MDISYIILAYKLPEQLKLLVNALNSSNVYFYIHVDKKIQIAPFHEALSGFKNVYFLAEKEREHSIWGDIGTTKATINAMRKIIADKRTGHCVLLSGQDYPIKSNACIKSFFELGGADTDYISLFSLPNNSWAEEGGLGRLKYYKINLSFQAGDYVFLASIYDSAFYSLYTLKVIYHLLKRKKIRHLFKAFKKRKYNRFPKPYGGEHWCALSVNTVKSCVVYTDANSDFLKFHEDTFIPEEIYFHTLVMFLKGTQKAESIRPQITYANWSRENVVLPVTFSESDFEELKNLPPDKLFARKFDIGIDDKILRNLDDYREINS